MGACRRQSGAGAVASSRVVQTARTAVASSTLNHEIPPSGSDAALAGFPFRGDRSQGPGTASRRSFASPVECLAHFLTRLLKLIRDWSRSDSRDPSSDRCSWQRVGSARRSCPGSCDAAGSVPNLLRGPGGGPRACRRSVAVPVQSRGEEGPFHQRGPRRAAFARSSGGRMVLLVFLPLPCPPGLQLRA